MRSLATFARLIVVLAFIPALPANAQAPRQPNWSAIEKETLQHFQALLRFNTSDPPGREQEAAEYLKQVMEKEGISVETFSLEPHRPNVVARLKGNGSKRPLLIMAHTDVVNVDPSKWKHPPFSATRDGGYVYARGAVDDKDNVVAALMAMLTLKRLNVLLDRDVIFLAEAGEEGSTEVGIEFMVNRHFPAIEAEFCLAEGGGVARVEGKVRYASVQTVEKLPRRIDMVAHGPSGHGSVPLLSNAVLRLAKAVAAAGSWRTPVHLNETTRTYFERLASISPPEEAVHYRNVLSSNAKIAEAADQHLRENEPRYASMLRNSISPTMIDGGYRVNLIPSDAKATLDVRLLPDVNPDEFLAALRTVVNDPNVEIKWGQRNTRPPSPSRLDTEALRVVEAEIENHYGAITLPTMSTGATDMAYLRAKGIQCYGIGPATDVEDGPAGFGAHSDQERILESELHRFVRFHYDVVAKLAAKR